VQANWPERALVIEDGVLEPERIEFWVLLAAVYRRTCPISQHSRGAVCAETLRRA
jgi:hypothetical protein